MFAAGFFLVKVTNWYQLFKIWTEKRSNKSVLEEVGEFKGLVNQMEQQKLNFMRHIMRHRCIENDLLTGMVFGNDEKDDRKPD